MTLVSGPTRFRLLALGGLHLKAPDGRAHPHVQKKRLALLVLLAVAGARGESRDRVAALLWPESDGERARQSLKQAVYALRQVLGAGAILADRNTLRLDDDAITSDVGEFLRSIAAGELSVAVDLYAGPFLDGWHMADDEDLERWIDDRRSQLAASAVAALRKLAARASAAGDAESAVRTLRRLVQLDPLTTEHTSALMETLVRAGDVVAAIREGERYQERMQRELGLVNPAITASLDTLRGQLSAQVVTASRMNKASTDDELPARVAVSTMEDIGGSRAEAIVTVPRMRILLGVAATVACVGALLTFVLWPSPSSTIAAGSVVVVLPLRIAGGDTLVWRGASEIVSNVLNDTRDFKAELALGPSGTRSTRTATCGSRGGLYVTGDAQVRDSAVVRLELRDACMRDSVLARSELASAPADGQSLLERVAMELVAVRRDGQLRRVAEVALHTTSDVRAARAFLQGQADFHAARYDSAVAAFGRATAIDSTFAIAYHWQSVAADWAGRPLIIESAARRAVALRQRLPTHDRMLADGWYALKFGRASDAESVFTSVANSFPDDATAWMQLGEVLFHGNSVRGRPVQDAVMPFRRVSELDPTDPQPVHHLIRLAAMRGDTTEVDTLTQRMLARSDQDSVELRAFQAFAHRDAKGQQRMVAALRRADPRTIAVSIWRTAAFARNVDAARVLATLLLDDPRAVPQRLFARDKLAELAVARGRWSDARQELQQAAASDPDATLEFRSMLAVIPPIVHADSELIALRERLTQLLQAPTEEAQKHVPVRLYLIGLLSDRLHDAHGLETSALRLESLKDADRYADPAFARSYAGGLRGLAARLAGRDADAIAQLEVVPYDRFPEYRAGALGSQTYERYALAELLAAAGRTAEALSWLRAIGDGLETSWYPASHVAVARIADARGDDRTARVEYTRFVDAWRGCDAAQAPVRDSARTRIDALTRFAGERRRPLSLSARPANGATTGQHSPAR